MNYQDRLKEAMNSGVTVGDFVIHDNVYTEFKKGVSVADLCVKYDINYDQAVKMLKALGEKVEEGAKTKNV